MVEVDISDLLEHGRDVAREHRGFGDRMLATLARAAAEERSSHAYRNRTGDLQASTRAVEVARSRDFAAVDLVMDEEYASFVVGRGLSNITELEARAEQALAADVGNMMARAER